jgi:hypothetical protein
MSEAELVTLNKPNRLRTSGQSMWKTVLSATEWGRVQPLLYPFIAWKWPDNLPSMKWALDYQTAEMGDGLVKAV